MGITGERVTYGEKLGTAIIREFKEETNLDVRVNQMIGVYSDPNRDPFGHYVSICFLIDLLGGKPQADFDEVSDIGFFDVFSKQLAFDHSQMIQDTLNIVSRV